MSNGGDGAAAGAGSEAPAPGEARAECVSAATPDVVEGFNLAAQCRGGEAPALDDAAYVEGNAATEQSEGGEQETAGTQPGDDLRLENSWNAAALAEATASQPGEQTERGPDDVPGAPESGPPNWYRHWENSGRLPPDPHPGDQGLPLWDPGKAYEENRAYLDDLAKGRASSPDVRTERGMRDFKEWDAEQEKFRARREQIEEWNRAALAQYRQRQEARAAGKPA